MRSLSVFLLLFASFTGVLRASPVVLVPETIIADPAEDPAWQKLFNQLSPQKTRLARFEERRTFPFRSKPIVLNGELRLAPDRGLSLSYAGDKPHIVIVDREGVLMRDARGRERAGPADRRASAATSALFNVLRFDLPALARDFVIHGLRDGEAWTLGFVSRDPALAELIGAIVVHGKNDRLNRIEMVKSDQQRIDILLADTRDDVEFTATELQRFFR